MIRLMKTAKHIVDFRRDTITRQPTSPPKTELKSWESTLFDYFRLYILPNLSGPFEPRPWYDAISPIFYECPPVRHAAIALSALVFANNIESGKSAQQVRDQSLAVKHYNAAIKCLSSTISALDTTSPNVILVTIVLFSAFELHQSEYRQAISHLNAALSFLNELQNGSSALPTLWKRQDRLDVSLSRLLQRLDVQISTFTSTRIRLNRIDRVSAPSSAFLASNIHCVEDASHILTLQLAAMRELVYEVQMFEEIHPNGVPSNSIPALQAEVAQQLHALTVWDREVSNLSNQLRLVQDRQALQVLRVHQICCRLLVATSLNNGREMLWDSFLADFDQLLYLLESLLDAPTACATWTSDSSFPKPCRASLAPDIHLDMGILPAAYLTVLKCRDRALRRRGLTILKTCQHREGAWDAHSSALQAEAIVELEEKDVLSSKVLPEQSRLYRAWYDLSRTGIGIIYCKRRLFETDGSWLEYQVHVR